MHELVYAPCEGGGDHTAEIVVVLLDMAAKDDHPPWVIFWQMGELIKSLSG